MKSFGSDLDAFLYQSTKFLLYGHWNMQKTMAEELQSVMDSFNILSSSGQLLYNNSLNLILITNPISEIFIFYSAF